MNTNDDVLDKTFAPSMHPVITELAKTDATLLHIFTPIERAVIEVCRDLANGGVAVCR